MRRERGSGGRVLEKEGERERDLRVGGRQVEVVLQSPFPSCVSISLASWFPIRVAGFGDANSQPDTWLKQAKLTNVTCEQN